MKTGYIDEITTLQEEEEDNKLKGNQSADFPSLKEFKKQAKKAKKSGMSLSLKH